MEYYNAHEYTNFLVLLNPKLSNTPHQQCILIRPLNMPNSLHLNTIKYTHSSAQNSEWLLPLSLIYPLTYCAYPCMFKDYSSTMPSHTPTTHHSKTLKITHSHAHHRAWQSKCPLICPLRYVTCITLHYGRLLMMNALQYSLPHPP